MKSKETILVQMNFRPDYSPIKDVSVNSMLLDLIKRMLIKEPEQRISLVEIF